MSILPPRLPQEIIEQVIDASDCPTLRSLVLVAKAWAPRSQRNLFRSVRWNYLTSRGLRDFLRRAPRFQRWIEHLNFSPGAPFNDDEESFEESTARVLREFLFQLIPLLPSLMSITVDFKDERILRFTIDQIPFFDLFSKLLERQGIRWVDAAVNGTNIGLLLPKLRNLAIKDISNTLRQPDFTSGPHAPSAIQSLNVVLDGNSHCTGRSHDQLALSQWLNPSNLKLLSFETFPGKSDFRDDDTAFGWISDFLIPSSASLQVLIYCPTPFVIRKPVPPPGFLLEQIPNLKALRISFAEWHTATHSAGWLARLLATADPSSSLDELTIILPVNFDSLMPFDNVLDGPGYASVRSVVLVDCHMSRSVKDVTQCLVKLPKLTDLNVHSTTKQKIGTFLKRKCYWN